MLAFARRGKGDFQIGTTGVPYELKSVSSHTPLLIPASYASFKSCRIENGTGLGFLKIGLASGLNRMSSEKSFKQPNVDSNKVENSPHSCSRFSTTYVLFEVIS